MRVSDKIRAAVVGCGKIGSFHAEKYSKIEEVELVGVCDLEVFKAERLAKKFNCNYYTDFHDLIDQKIECVSVASDSLTHFEITKIFLENGIDVLVEKPMTSTIDEAKHLIDISKNTQTVLQVGHLERFNPAIKKIKENLKNPWFFEIRRISAFTGRGADVNVILDLMIHDIDLLLYLVNSPIERIEAVGIPVLTGTIDVANARISFKGGIVANVSASRAAIKSERTFRIFQPENYISMDLDAKKLKVVSRGAGKSILGFPNIKQTEETLDLNDSLADEIKSFVACVKTRTTPVVSGQDGLNALEVVREIKNAMRVSAEKFGQIPDELLQAIEN